MRQRTESAADVPTVNRPKDEGEKEEEDREVRQYPQPLGVARNSGSFEQPPGCGLAAQYPVARQNGRPKRRPDLCARRAPGLGR